MAPSTTVQSLARGLAILEAAAGMDSFSVQEMADLLGLKRPTVHSLVTTLVDHDFLKPTDRRGQYQLGPAVRLISERSSQRVMELIAGRAMRERHATIPWASLVYTERVGMECYVKARVDPSRPGVLQHPPLYVLPPYSKTTAMILLAFLDPPQRAAIEQRYRFFEYGTPFWPGIEAYHKALEQAVRQGWIERRSDAERTYAVAAPIFQGGGVCQAALGGFVLGNGDREQLRTVVCALAEQVSAVLRGRDDEPSSPEA